MKLGGRDIPPPPQILAGQLTLFRLGDQIMVTLLFSPLDFQTYRHSVAVSRAESLSFFFLPPYSLTIYREHSTTYNILVVG